MRPLNVFVGYDPREIIPYEVTIQSILDWSDNVSVRPIILSHMRERGLYTRAIETRKNPNGVDQLWDPISEYWMATEFAISRFLTPHLAGRNGWAVFIDSDMLARANLSFMSDSFDDKYALMVVKHKYEPTETEKMEGRVQGQYARKNWSSVMAFNCRHPANRRLTLNDINTLPGRDLHRFYWLDPESVPPGVDDDEHGNDHYNTNLIGELEPKWNWLVGHSDQAIDPALVHFTLGTPDMNGRQDDPYADEWREVRDRIARWT